MYRVAACLLIFLTTSSFKINDKAGPQPGSGLLSRIAEARALLASERVQVVKGTVGTRRVKVGRRKYEDVPVIGVLGREMAIAILDAEGGIRVARAIKRDKGMDVLTPGFVLSVRRDNGINSDIVSVNPAGGKILAVKYPVLNEGNRFGPGSPVIEAVYTPYSREIASEEVIAQGIAVQAEFIERAYARLQERRVYSRAFPGKLVVDVVPRDVLTVLLMNEHIDPSLFKSSGHARTLVEQVLTVIATNREKAYAYSVSSAGARGLVQMIPSTYSLLLNRYASAGLLSSFATGMADPTNAVMAQVLLCDADWQAIRTKGEIPAETIGPYLAAAYNGGVGRVLSIMAQGEHEWMEEPSADRRPTKVVTARVPVKVRTRRGRTRTAYVMKSYTRPIFMSETSKYVRQYHWINDFFVARNIDGFKQSEAIK
ncbi:MAG TPA: hypothetical protein VE262_18510 [Blastocatellia bacterium]|nr:hypothetical protein [Blastocatellia bacterium]